jgi:hypothetical protein
MKTLATSGEAIQQLESNIETVRSLTMAERAALLDIACASAAELECSRRINGLPPSQPTPWPASTWDFLRKTAADARR